MNEKMKPFQWKNILSLSKTENTVTMQWLFFVTNVRVVSRYIALGHDTYHGREVSSYCLIPNERPSFMTYCQWRSQNSKRARKRDVNCQSCQQHNFMGLVWTLVTFFSWANNTYVKISIWGYLNKIK